MTFLPPRIKHDSGKKICAACGVEFSRPAKLNAARWERTRCCSISCGKQKPLSDRLLSRIVKWEGGCWEWTGTKDRDGYGRIIIKRPGKRFDARAHRVAYQEWVGPFEQDLLILHSCDNPSCVNPDHLRPGTPKDNMIDKMVRGRCRNGATGNAAS